MAVSLASRGELAKIEAKLDAAVACQVQEICKTQGEQSQVVRARLESMKANLLQRFKDNIVYSSWEVTDDEDSARGLPPAPVIPYDTECKDLEKEVQRLVESIAEHRATVLPIVSKRVSADMARLRQAAERKELAEGEDQGEAPAPLEPSPEALRGQLRAALERLPELERRLEDVTNVTSSTFTALESNRKRPPPGTLELALNDQLPGTGDTDESGAAKKQTRQRLVQDLRSAKLA
uniref:Uncharacterized protein n=1 Tax=Pyramimonas obovata TaxID=1411642 RepID=A0A7S0QV86_9CHLO|mmetsp:Transcript_22146/g.48607  ORF Transcript_22146/g.48607 Transcript_22146/m.48607 type:complete len:236 (+) Transcript_22146:202-909(+)|eukprot:CAMPEP_0118934828 /NCGR_PEP_ID=MMETSP1169-20130426/14230_1 /TAXON_ID=36882 /ORGANISM="Pyramimonas obovata, Strain CCMP722" /LENGTH=235 /DNA_ID=CAMNT_0006877769 /DNA_START=201 /DNA_END=908 /DNA_ORIENTATION=+